MDTSRVESVEHKPKERSPYTIRSQTPVEIDNRNVPDGPQVIFTPIVEAVKLRDRTSDTESESSDDEPNDEPNNKPWTATMHTQTAELAVMPFYTEIAVPEANQDETLENDVETEPVYMVVVVVLLDKLFGAVNLGPPPPKPAKNWLSKYIYNMFN